MKLKLAAVVIALGATGTTHPSAPQPQMAEMPWLHGLDGAKITSTPKPSATSIDELDEGCAAGAFAPFELVADVAPTAGNETVRASFVDGVVVRDREGAVVASASGYNCEGSADEIVALAAGSAHRDSTIALAFTYGGRREQVTALALFRIGFGGKLDPVFTAEVEQRTDERVRRGNVWLFPNGLIYQRPGGRPTIWVFDPVDRAYLYRGPLEETDEPPHVEPPPINSDLQARR